jgi:hypothetical protein
VAALPSLLAPERFPSQVPQMKMVLLGHQRPSGALQLLQPPVWLLLCRQRGPRLALQVWGLQ